MLRLKQITLLFGDTLLLYLGLYTSLWLRYGQVSPRQWNELVIPMSFLYLLATILMFITGLYDISRAKNNRSFYQKILLSAGIWFIIGTLYFYFNPKQYITPKTIFFLNTLIGFGFISIWRWLHNRFLSTVIWSNGIIFAGLTNEVNELVHLLENEPQRGYRVLALIDPTNNSTRSFLSDTTPCVSTLDEYLKHSQIVPNLIVVTSAMANNQDFLKTLYPHLFEQIEVVELAHFYEQIMGRIPPFIFSESWFITHLREQQKKIYDRLRILIDYFVVLFLAFIFVLTFPFIALAIKLTSSGPVFFKQKRIGRQEKPFTMYKYRTMKVLGENGSAETSGPQFASKNDARITMVGSFLRRTRLDELPQCINILKNEMALIGPRPERPEFVRELVSKMPFYSLRHLIKPGLTGWAQLQHSYYGTLDENLQKLEYDLYYIKNRGPVLDLAILLRTINIVAGMKGR